MRIVPICEVVAAYIDKNPEFSPLVEPPTPEIENWLSSQRT